MRPILADKRTIFLYVCKPYPNKVISDFNCISKSKIPIFFVLFFLFFGFQHLNFSAAS